MAYKSNVVHQRSSAGTLCRVQHVTRSMGGGVSIGAFADAARTPRQEPYRVKVSCTELCGARGGTLASLHATGG